MASKLLSRPLLSSLKCYSPQPSRYLISSSRLQLIRPLAPSSYIRGLTSTPSSAFPHSNHPLLQYQQPTSDPSQSTETARPYHEIPKTKTTLGLNLDLMKDPSNVIDYMKTEVNQLGHIFKIVGIPGLPSMVCVVDPKDVELVFRVGDAGYPERFNIKEWKDARKEANAPLGMFLANGEHWHQQRMPVSKFILMPRKMAEYHEPFNHVALDYIELLRKQRREDNIFLDITASLNKWSLESVSLFVLGKRMGCLGDEMPPECKQFVDDMHSFLATTQELFYGLPFHKIWRTKKWKELIRSQAGVLDYASSLVNEKIREIEKEDAGRTDDDVQAELGTDFLTYMVHSDRMSVQKIAVNAMDLLNAGVDTTSLTMAGCLYALATNPDVQDRLREEVRSVLGQDDEVVTAQHIQDMPYLRDTIKETMRLYPIAPNNSRILKEDVVLSGYKVPAGTNIIMSTLASGRLSEFFPEPEKFKPERWSRDSAEPPNAFTSLPFGFGRRMCVGRRVAELEMHILLAQLMRNFRVEFREEEPIKFVTKLFFGPGRQMDLALVDMKYSNVC